MDWFTSFFTNGIQGTSPSWWLQSLFEMSYLQHYYQAFLTYVVTRFHQLQDPVSHVQFFGLSTLWMSFLLALSIGLVRAHYPTLSLQQSIRRVSHYVKDVIILRRPSNASATTTAGGGDRMMIMPFHPASTRGTSGGGGTRPRLNTGTTTLSDGGGWWPSLTSNAVSTATASAAGTVQATRIRLDSYNNPTNVEEDDEEYYEFTSPFYWDNENEAGGTIDERESAYYYNYYGPHLTVVAYETWTPPPSWIETSKTVIPYQHRLPLQKVIELQLSDPCQIRILPPGVKALLSSTPTTTSATATYSKLQEVAFQLPITEIATHIEHAEGAVLHVYVQESSREEWMEHTFKSASECAQFQTDVLALQLLGTSIYDMYQALELLHRGSLACPTQELVLHDDSFDLVHDHPEKDGNDGSNHHKSEHWNTQVQSKGIAWDDVVRCLGSSFPSIRYRLEALWWKHALPVTPRRQQRRQMPRGSSSGNDTTGNPRSPTASKSTDQNEPSKSTTAGDSVSGLLTEDYLKKRLLLGPIDFFRLFAPTVPILAIPKVGVDAGRVEQLLRWRKRVARASVLVHAYVEARAVVNVGWNPIMPLPDEYWKRRLAYDDNTDNVRWDSSHENEYYEGTVSRDVFCRVRGIDSLWKQPRWSFGFGHQIPQYSPVQGYSLVAIHTFRIDDDCPLQPNIDPVLALPSLRTLLESHAHLDFFISCMYPELLEVAFCHIGVFVRSLPKGIDQSFDTSMERYVHGTAEERDERIELIFQLQSNQEGMSWTSWITILVVSFLVRFSFSGDSPPSQSSKAGERTVLPAMRLSSCGDTYHFGGALVPPHRGFPSNYVAHSLHLDSRKNVNLAMRILLSYFARGGFRQDVLDFTYVLAGRKVEELPERALATVRLVHASPLHIALPWEQVVADDKKPSENHNSTRGPLKDSTVALDSAALYFRLFVSDPIDATLNQIVNTFSALTPRSGTQSGFDEFLDDAAGLDPVARVMATSDVFERAVNELVRILERIEVPVKRTHQLLALSISKTNPNAGGLAISTTNQESTLDEIAAVPILSQLSRSEILRFFIASGCSHKRTVVRLVESMTWRGLTFPIDTRVCRVELQSGQFFQQGRDKAGNPVFYFRNMLRGNWRKDENASIAAVLHRLDRSFRELQEKSDFRVTVVVMMGKPHKPKHKNLAPTYAAKSGEYDADADGNRTDNDADDDGSNTAATKDADTRVEWHAQHNPRIDYQEHYQLHTSKQMIRSLINLLLAHYPERLAKAYVVVGHGNTAYSRTAVGASVRLPKYIQAIRTRDKVRILLRYSELREYISNDQLLAIAGGSAHIDTKAFGAS